jgi:signal transduction histidine kinase
MAREIYRAAEHMRVMVDNLLELGRIEAGEVILFSGPCELPRLVEQAVEHVRLLEGREHEYLDLLDPALPPVMADPQRVGQVLNHLLVNATRYSPPGSAIRIGARCFPAHVEVWVADDGAGIDPGRLERVFEKFYRGDVSLTGQHPGAGIGLTACRSLVEAHGGRIWAESQGLGHGTTVRFTLPVAPGLAAETPAPATGAQAETGATCESHACAV